MTPGVVYVAVPALPATFDRVVEWVEQTIRERPDVLEQRVVIDLSQLDPANAPPSAAYLEGLARALRPLLAQAELTRCALVVPTDPMLWRARLFESLTSGSRISFRAFMTLAAAASWVRADLGNSALDDAMLVIEDDATLRDSIVRALSDEGWEVISAIDAVDAFRVLSEYRGRVTLVVADIDASPVSATEFLEPFRRWYPSMPCILLSRDATVCIPQEMVGPHSAMVAKPFTADELVSAVRQLIR